jgi:very-short-patch-repair endonuclease
MRARIPKEEKERSLFHHAARNYGVFHREEARSLGYSDSAIGRLVATGRVERLWPSVFRLASAPATVGQRARAATLYVGKGAWLSHRWAAVHHGMTDGVSGSVEILTDRERRSRPGLKIRRVKDMPCHDVRTLRSIPVTNTIRTMIDLAAVLPAQRLEAVLDDCIWRGFVAVPRLIHRLNDLGSRGRKGAKLLRELLAERDDGCPIPLNVLERKFLKVLRTAGLDEPEKQASVPAEGSGRWRLDFAYPHHKVLIEVDGGRWHSGKQQASRDRRRDNVMNIRGWTVLRFTWEDVVHNPAYVVEQVKRALGIVELW